MNGLAVILLAMLLMGRVAGAGPSDSTAGAAQCASCHRAQAITQPTTSMGHALERVADSEILRSNPQLTFRQGSFTYRIKREADRSVYSVSRGIDILTVPIGFAIGLGSAGQTYVYQRNGIWYESRVSFYKSIGGLDLTMGHAAAEPNDPEDAAGREIGAQELMECFGCHSTHAVRDSSLHLDTLIPGVQCERCHGPAKQHVAALKSGDVKGAAMRRLDMLSTEEMSDFCGQCHRTWAQIAMKGPHNVNNVRFQPYRLANSRCYDATDRRIRCVACHDPHVEVERTAAFYDSKCLACHAPPGGHSEADSVRRVKTCPTATKNCVTCHMPKYEIPGSHNLFTDHQIRIAKPGEHYPA